VERRVCDLLACCFHSQTDIEFVKIVELQWCEMERAIYTIAAGGRGEFLGIVFMADGLFD
jgi:hypothetical protein